MTQQFGTEENNQDNLESSAIASQPTADKNEPHVVEMARHYTTFHVSSKTKRHMMELLTQGGRNNTLKNVVLDIADVPMSRDAFNVWLLDLIRTTELTVVDNSFDITVEEGIRPVKKPDGTYEDKYLDPVPYPYDLDFSTGEFNEDLMPVKVAWVKAGSVICTGVNQFEYAEKDQEFQYRINNIVEPVVERAEIINKVMHQRDLLKEIESLSDYCELDEKGYKVFTVGSTNKVIERINNLIESGQTIRPLFGLGTMPDNRESAYNIAKLFILSNELIELDQLSSGKTLCTKYVYPYVSQFTYDYNSYSSFSLDFMDRHPQGSSFLMCKIRGIFETAKVVSYRVVENDNGTTKYLIKFAYMELRRNLMEEELDLQEFYSMHRISLPLGYSEGTEEGLLPFDDRTKFFNRELKDMRAYEEQVNYDGISQFIGSNIHYDANTDYVQGYKNSLQAEYHELGLGDLPEIDLKAIVSGADSPYSHNARKELAKRASQKSKFNK